MRCSSCEPLLDRYVEGTLTPREMARVTAHLRSVRTAKRCLTELRVVDALLATTAPVELAPNFTFAVMAEARTAPDPRSSQTFAVGCVDVLHHRQHGSRSAACSPFSGAARRISRRPVVRSHTRRRRASPRFPRRHTASARRRRSCSLARSASFARRVAARRRALTLSRRTRAARCRRLIVRRPYERSHLVISCSRSFVCNHGVRRGRSNQRRSRRNVCRIGCR